MAVQRVRCPALWGLVACLLIVHVTRPVAGDSFTLYLLQSSPICLAVSKQTQTHSDHKCKNGFDFAWLADVTQLDELGTVLTSGVQYHVAVTYKAGRYEWSDGQPVDGALWAIGEPSAGQCGAVKRSGSTRLTGVNCVTVKAKYICRNTTQSCSGATTIKPLPSAAPTSTAVIPTTTASTHQPTTLHTDRESTTLQSELETTSQSKPDSTTSQLNQLSTTPQFETETTSLSEHTSSSHSETQTTSLSEHTLSTSHSDTEVTSLSQPELTASRLDPISTTSQSDTESSTQLEADTTQTISTKRTVSDETTTTEGPPVTSQSDTDSSAQLEADTTQTINTKRTVSDETTTTEGPPVTSQSGDTAPSLTSQPQYWACRCQRVVQTNATARAARVKEAEDSAERLRQDQTLVKHNLSSAVRTKTSAPDDRWSARAAGGVSIAVLLLVSVTVIVLDLAPLRASLTATVGVSPDHTHSACQASSGVKDTSSQPSVGYKDTPSQPSVGDTDKSSVASCGDNDTSLSTRDKKDDQTT